MAAMLSLPRRTRASARANARGGGGGRGSSGVPAFDLVGVCACHM